MRKVYNIFIGSYHLDWPISDFISINLSYIIFNIRVNIKATSFLLELPSPDNYWPDLSTSLPAENSIGITWIFVRDISRILYCFSCLLVGIFAYSASSIAWQFSSESASILSNDLIYQWCLFYVVRRREYFLDFVTKIWTSGMNFCHK